MLEKSYRRYTDFSLQIEVRKCLLLFGEQLFVFQATIQKFKDQDI